MQVLVNVRLKGRQHVKTKFYGLVFMVLISGCAVTPQEVNQITQEKKDIAADLLHQAKFQLEQEGFMKHVQGNFLGDTPIDLPYSSKLPPLFFQKLTLRSRGASFGTIAQAARNIQIATGLPVRVNPDVELTPQLNSPNTAQYVAPEPAQSQAVASAVSVNRMINIPLDYSGSLINYLNTIGIQGGVNWDWREGGIYIYRLVTKTFVVSNITTGDYSVTDSMNRGGSVSSGTTGVINATGNGNFSSGSSISLQGMISPWKALLAELNTVLSPLGKLSVNDSLGSVTVTDSKENVARVEKLVNQENASFGKQVAIEVRVIQVSLSKESQLGVNLGLVYSALNSSQTAATKTLAAIPPSTTTSTAAGTLTFRVPDTTSPYSNTNFSLAALNAFGDIVQDTATTLYTTNRVPVMSGNYSTQGFLAQTTPAIGGAVAGGSGVPGLTPGSITVGTFLRVLPTIKDNNSILVNLSMDLSSLNKIGNATTGEGATLQQIQWANTTGSKSVVNLFVNQNESIVTVGIVSDVLVNNVNASFDGASRDSNKNKSIFVLIIKPRVLRGF